jgi:hypothetical protein
MTSEEILNAAKPGCKLQVLNSPFVYDGKVTINLEGGEKMYWIFSQEDRMLSVNPGLDEVVAFLPFEEDVEGDSEALMHRGEEYEFSYEDKGSVEGSLDGADYDEGAKITLRDFEAEDGEIIRVANSTHLEDPINFIGQAALEDDILQV